MSTLETAIVWPVIFAVFLCGIVLGIKTAQVAFKQVERYENTDNYASPSEITRIIEVVYETIDEI